MRNDAAYHGAFSPRFTHGPALHRVRGPIFGMSFSPFEGLQVRLLWATWLGAQSVNGLRDILLYLVTILLIIYDYTRL